MTSLFAEPSGHYPKLFILENLPMAGVGFGRFQACGVGRKTIAKLRHQGFGFATHFEQLRKVFFDRNRKDP
jgi:hypothetical protein